MAETTEKGFGGADPAEEIEAIKSICKEEAPETDAEIVRDRLSEHHDGKYGYAVYRCTYESDELWSRSVETLRSHCHARIDRDEHGSEIRDSFTLDVTMTKDVSMGLAKAKCEGIRG